MSSKRVQMLKRPPAFVWRDTIRSARELNDENFSRALGFDVGPAGGPGMSPADIEREIHDALSTLTDFLPGGGFMPGHELGGFGEGPAHPGSFWGSPFSEN